MLYLYIQRVVSLHEGREIFQASLGVASQKSLRTPDVTYYFFSDLLNAAHFCTLFHTLTTLSLFCTLSHVIAYCTILLHPFKIWYCNFCFSIPKMVPSFFTSILNYPMLPSFSIIISSKKYLFKCLSVFFLKKIQIFKKLDHKNVPLY